MNRDFGEKLTTWYAQNRRNLPWRNTHNPYKIWLSELILQQTRVNQGVVYCNQFVRSYPNIFLLAEAQKANLFGALSYTIGTPSSVYRQQLTHLKVSACFIPVFIKELFDDETKKSLLLVRENQIINYPVPRLIARYLQDQNIKK